MDDTLSLIILPMLKQLNESKAGAPAVDDEDVPEHLRSTAAPPLTAEQINTGSPDDNWFKRWEWVMSEMIWAFENLVDETADDDFYKNHDWKGLEEFEKRIERGTTLFGKYYRGLWD